MELRIPSRLRQLTTSWSYEADAAAYAFSAMIMRAVVLDISFTVLPIGVIFLIVKATRGDLAGILRWPEWSFAAIVFYGMAISKHIELKTHYQKDFSYRLDAGSRLFAILLVFSVLIHSMAILLTRGFAIDPKIIETLQVPLFVCSIGAIIMSELFAQSRLYYNRSMPWRLPARVFYDLVKGTLQDMSKRIEYLGFSLERAGESSGRAIDERYYIGSKRWHCERRLEIRAAIEGLERAIIHLKTVLSEPVVTEEHITRAVERAETAP